MIDPKAVIGDLVLTQIALREEIVALREQVKQLEAERQPAQKEAE